MFGMKKKLLYKVNLALRKKIPNCTYNSYKVNLMVADIDLGPSLYYVSKRTGWVGLNRKWPVLLTFGTVFMLIRWVDGV